MKNFLAFAISVLFTYNFFAQQIIVSPEKYSELKKKGELNTNKNYIPHVEFKNQKPVKNTKIQKVDSASSNCGCNVPLDASFQVCDFTDGFPPDYREDDGSTPLKLLPFTFCFYGTNYNSVYINRNGNITFGAASAVFTSTGFPVAGNIMIAPFWSDVDTRNPQSGLVYYKIAPNYMIVKWDSVGYYNSYADKLNTFQLIISDGTDSLIPGNDNVAFCYGEMQWTTGDASGGSNGFGGSPATVGVNKGDGINFIQLGQFDQTGNAYDGPYLTTDGIDWLDNQNFYFNVCGSGSNLPPLPLGGATAGCGPADTIQLCGVGDTLIYSISFTGPENNQTVSITGTAPTLGPNFILNSSTSGNITTATFMIIGSASVVGTHLITVTATDNGNPALSSSVSYIVNIPPFNGPTPVITLNPTPACANVPVTATLQNCSAYAGVTWSDGSNGCSITSTQNGQIYVTTTDANGCSQTNFANITISPSPTVSITGTPNFCNSGGTTLTASVTTSGAAITNYNWSGIGTATTNTINVTSAGTLSVTVTDANGCTASSTINVTNNTLTTTISSNFSSFCPGQPVTLTASLAGGTYTWSGPGGPFANTQSIIVNPVSSSTYSVLVSVNGCLAQNTITLNPLTAPTLSATSSAYCTGQNSVVTASANPPGAYSYTWTPSGITTSTFTTNTPGTYTVIASVNGGCPGTTTVSVAAPNANPNISLNTVSGSNIICYKKDQIIQSNVSSGSPAYTYTWTPAVTGQSQTGTTYTVSNAGTYQLIVSDQNGCKDTANITLTMVVPNVTVSGGVLICQGDTGLLTANGSSTTPVNYNWVPGAVSTNTLQVTSQGLYSVTVTDQNGCQITAVTSVNYYPQPTGTILANPASPGIYGQSSTFTPSLFLTTGVVTQYNWNMGDGTNYTGSGPISHQYAQPGIYPVTLIVETNYGCVDTFIISYDVQVLIPAVNIITPNGDAINGNLEFKGLEFYPNNKLTIYNRWGKKLFEKTNYDNKWNGENHVDGTYYYILEIPKGKPDEIIKGHFLINR